MSSSPFASPPSSTDSAVQALVKKEYFPNQFTVIARHGDRVTVGSESLAWHAVDTINYNVNLYHFAYALSKPTSNVLFWAVTSVDAPRDMLGVRLAIGSNAASVWWLNGQEVIGLYNDRQAVIDDGVSKRVTLKKGPNVIRAAIVNAGGATDFCARFLDGKDNPIKGNRRAPGRRREGRGRNRATGSSMSDATRTRVTVVASKGQQMGDHRAPVTVATTVMTTVVPKAHLKANR